MEESQLTKKEIYLLKKGKKEKERLWQIHRQKIKRVALISLPAILIVGGIVFAVINRSSEKNQQGTPKIEISPLEYDVGTISMVAGLVKKTYEIKNIGDGDLKIDRIWTSCHCTTARLKVGGKISPEFSMESVPIFWSQKIASGETGHLEVTFDPAFHGLQGIGPVVRAVYLSTNDPKNKKAEVRLIANVIQ